LVVVSGVLLICSMPKKDTNNPIIKAYGPRTTNTSLTLYERMGGEQKLEAVVDGVYKLMASDKVIGKQFSRFRLERLKDRTVDYLRGEFGGEEYNSSDLWISHSHLAVKNDWYDIMMKYYVKVLKQVGIPKAETAEILESLEKMRIPIVDPGQKLKEIYLRHIEKESAKAGGDGWTVGTGGGKEDDAAEDDAATGTTVASATDKPDPKLAAIATAPAEVASPDVVNRRRSPRAMPPPDRKFYFRPACDAPPAQVPSSAPSGAELLYRLSNPPQCSAKTASRRGS